MFEFKITLDDDDFLLFNQYNLFNSTIGKKNLMVFRLIIPFIALMFAVVIFLVTLDFQLFLIEAIVMTILSILWIGFSKKMLLISLNKNIKKMKKEGKLLYTNEAVIKFDDEIIHEISPNTELKLKYQMVEKIAVTEKAIYIYFGSQAFVLPVTAFSDDTQKQKFLEFINSKT